jgi:PAS domain-containing protein
MASLRHGVEEPGDAQDIRLVVDTIPTLAWFAGPDGSAEFHNRRWLDYTGLSAKQALGPGWEAAIHPDDLPRILETFREALNSGKPYEVEGRFPASTANSAGLSFAAVLCATDRGKSRSGTEQIPILRSAIVPKMPSARAKHPCLMPNG